MLIRLLYTVLYAHIFLRWDSFTRKHFYTEVLWHTVAGTFTCKYFYTAVFILRAFSSHTHMLCHRDAFAHTCFYREVFLHIDTFAQREMPFYTQILLQRDDFTLSNFTQTPKQTKVLLQRNACARRVFSYGHFHTDILLNYFLWRTRVWRKEFSEHMQITVSPQLLMVETHFVGKGWPRTNPHCILTSIYDYRHFVRTGCVSWTSIHAALLLEEKS